MDLVKGIIIIAVWLLVFIPLRFLIDRKVKESSGMDADIKKGCLFFIIIIIAGIVSMLVAGLLGFHFPYSGDYPERGAGPFRW